MQPYTFETLRADPLNPPIRRLIKPPSRRKRRPSRCNIFLTLHLVERKSEAESASFGKHHGPEKLHTHASSATARLLRPPRPAAVRRAALDEVCAERTRRISASRVCAADVAVTRCCLRRELRQRWHEALALWHIDRGQRPTPLTFATKASTPSTQCPLPSGSSVWPTPTTGKRAQCGARPARSGRTCTP